MCESPRRCSQGRLDGTRASRHKLLLASRHGNVAVRGNGPSLICQPSPGAVTLLASPEEAARAAWLALAVPRSAFVSMAWGGAVICALGH